MDNMLFGNKKVLQLQFTSSAIVSTNWNAEFILEGPVPPSPIPNKAITRETVIPDFEIGTFFQNFRIGPIFQFNLNIWEGEENAGVIQSVPADRGIIISKIILKL